MTKILRRFQQIVPTLSIVEFSVDPCDLFYGWYFYGHLDAKLGNLRLVHKQWKQPELCQSRSQSPRSFWSATEIATSGLDLWLGPTPEVRDSRTSCHSAQAQSQVWQIWLVPTGLNLLSLQSHSKPECRWTRPGVPISSAWQKGPLGTRLGLCRKACTDQ